VKTLSDDFFGNDNHYTRAVNNLVTKIKNDINDFIKEVEEIKK